MSVEVVTLKNMVVLAMGVLLFHPGIRRTRLKSFKITQSCVNRYQPEGPRLTIARRK